MQLGRRVGILPAEGLDDPLADHAAVFVVGLGQHQNELGNTAPGGDVCGERGDLRWTEGASGIEGVYRGNGISYPQHRIFPKGKGNRQGKHHPWGSKTEESCGAVGIKAAVDHRTGSEGKAAAVNIKWHLTRFGVWWLGTLQV